MTVNKDEIRHYFGMTTPGEWYLDEDEEGTMFVMAISPDVPGRAESVFGFDPELNCKKEDALFVVNAPSYVESLLASDDAKEETIRQLRQDNTALRECLEWYGDGSEDGGEKARTLLFELDRKDTQPPNFDRWWCPTCKEHVHPADVTFQETHDVRNGGCGNPVVGRVEDTQGEGGQ